MQFAFVRGKAGVTALLCFVSNMLGHGEWVWENQQRQIGGNVPMLIRARVCVCCVCCVYIYV